MIEQLFNRCRLLPLCSAYLRQYLKNCRTVSQYDPLENFGLTAPIDARLIRWTHLCWGRCLTRLYFNGPRFSKASLARITGKENSNVGTGHCSRGLLRTLISKELCYNLRNLLHRLVVGIELEFLSTFFTHQNCPQVLYQRTHGRISDTA